MNTSASYTITAGDYNQKNNPNVESSKRTPIYQKKKKKYMQMIEDKIRNLSRAFNRTPFIYNTVTRFYAPLIQSVIMFNESYCLGCS